MDMFIKNTLDEYDEVVEWLTRRTSNRWPHGLKPIQGQAIYSLSKKLIT